MDARKIAVTLICSAHDEAVAQPVIRGLRAVGREAGLISGVDSEPRLVGEALDQSDAWRLLFACESAHLDGPAMRKVEGVYSARRGPKHGLVRLDISQSSHACIQAVEQAVEAFSKDQGRQRRQPREGGKDLHLREVVQLNESSGIALPIVRLSPSEELDGDTSRLQLPDNPISSELVRRRKVARERAREKERSSSALPIAAKLDLAEAGGSTTAGRVAGGHDSAKLRELLTIGLIILAGVVAVLATLVL